MRLNFVSAVQVLSKPVALGVEKAKKKVGGRTNMEETSSDSVTNNDAAEGRANSNNKFSRFMSSTKVALKKTGSASLNLTKKAVASTKDRVQAIRENNNPSNDESIEIIDGGMVTVMSSDITEHNEPNDVSRESDVQQGSTTPEMTEGVEITLVESGEDSIPSAQSNDVPVAAGTKADDDVNEVPGENSVVADVPTDPDVDAHPPQEIGARTPTSEVRLPEQVQPPKPHDLVAPGVPTERDVLDVYTPDADPLEPKMDAQNLIESTKDSPSEAYAKEATGLGQTEGAQDKVVIPEVTKSVEQDEMLHVVSNDGAATTVVAGSPAAVQPGDDGVGGRILQSATASLVDSEEASPYETPERKGRLGLRKLLSGTKSVSTRATFLRFQLLSHPCFRTILGCVEG